MRRLLAGIFVSCASLTGNSAVGQTLIDRACERDQSVRNIEIRLVGEDQSLPCEVIYRPTSGDDTAGTVAWRGIKTEQACVAKADEIADRLTNDGWSCDIIKDEASQTAALEPSPSQPLASEDDLELDPPPVIRTSDTLTPPPARLMTAIKSDVERLDLTLNGRFDINIADYGNLDDDGLDDAVVVVTYDTDQPVYRQFLLAYLSEAGRYHLAATRWIGGSAKGLRDATVEEIDADGIIHLTLRAFDPGDQECCPSRQEKLALKLENLDLVEVSSSISSR